MPNKMKIFKTALRFTNVLDTRGMFNSINVGSGAETVIAPTQGESYVPTPSRKLEYLAELENLKENLALLFFWGGI